MKLKINRFNKEFNIDKIEEYEVKNSKTILDSLLEVKTKKDNTLTFRCGCRTGVCGSCSIRVNGIEKLACKSNLNENDLIEPIKNATVIKDLVVDLSHEKNFLKNSNAFLNELSKEVITTEDEKLIDRQSNCILCQNCFSSCPVYEVNNNFLGPYALTRALRYANDKKEANNQEILKSIQKDGIWDCTMCGNCTLVCPQFIDPKTDILNLRMKSVQNGYEDKSIVNFTNYDNFNTGFDPSGGFDPNGF